MNLSHLSRSALLTSILTLVSEPSWAEKKTSGAPAAKQREGKTEPKVRRTPPGEAATLKALDARARARKAKEAGEQRVAERLEKVALIWEKVADHQEKAAKLEEDAAQIERRILDIKSQARRAHSLVEQTETRRARALARLRELGMSDVPASTNPAGGSGAKDSKGGTESKAGSK